MQRFFAMQTLLNDTNLLKTDLLFMLIQPRSQAPGKRSEGRASFHPEMALFHNFCVDLRDFLFPPSRRDAQSLDLLDLAKNCSFLNWKLKLVPIVADFYFWMGTCY